jgi:hypothetical protein
MKFDVGVNVIMLPFISDVVETIPKGPVTVLLYGLPVRIGTLKVIVIILLTLLISELFQGFMELIIGGPTVIGVLTL